MTMSDELLSCPFCGCSNIHADWHYNENSDGGGRGIVTCAECGVEVTSADPGWMNCQADRDKCVSDAIAAWNRRVPAPAVPDDVAKIVAELREWDHCWPAPWLEGSVRKAADALEAQAAELARHVAERVREAVEAEREACAQVAETSWCAEEAEGRIIADAIRARGNKENLSE